MWPIEEREKRPLFFVAKSYPLLLAERLRRYGSLININPSGEHVKAVLEIVLQLSFKKCPVSFRHRKGLSLLIQIVPVPFSTEKAYLEGFFICYKRNVTRKIKTCTELWQILI